MDTLLRIASLALPIALLAPACSTSDGEEPSNRIRLEAATDDCQDVQTICLETYPPQCFDVCGDDDGGGDPGGDDCDAPDGTEPGGSTSDGDVVLCGDDPCVVGIDDDGQETYVCADPDCTVSFDAETGEETFSCPPSDGDDDGSGGSEPGNPGTGE